MRFELALAKALDEEAGTRFNQFGFCGQGLLL